jgi:protein involved in polysaccharide export with SLBB domain
VPTIPNSINVLGEVLNPLAFVYSKKLSVNSAINQAGGYKEYADKRRVYIIKANGMIEKASKNIFTKNVKLGPGDTIVVPQKIITGESGLKAIVPLTQILSDLAFSAAAIDNLTNN